MMKLLFRVPIFGMDAETRGFYAPIVGRVTLSDLTLGIVDFCFRIGPFDFMSIKFASSSNFASPRATLVSGSL